MDLRPELLPPPVDKRRVDEISAEITRIGGLLDSRLHAEADLAIAAFNADTGRDYSLADFLEYDGWRSLEAFALEAARPAWPRVTDFRRDELIEIVRRIQDPEPESDYYPLLFRANTPHPHALSLIYRPPARLTDATPEAVVDAALAYRPITL